ncbi:MAG TPA: hypothetical protein VG010_10465 [Solirubrobacteraceae bacterium]|nr:hypothetical protein [Solirubrobacteraceae bacterium]
MLALAVALLFPAQAAATPALGWSAPATIDSAPLSAVSCVSESFCVAVDRSGGVLSATDPASPGAPWTSPAAIDSGHVLTAVSCPSAGLCVAVDDRGVAFTATHPVGGGWSSLALGTAALTGVSCPNSSLCVAVDEAGRVFASSNPASPAASWSTVFTNAGPLQGVSCSGSECVAVDSAGGVLASASPGSGSWRHRALVPGALALTAVSCGGAACVAVDAGAPGGGDVLASADAAGGSPTWSSTGVDPHGGLAAASCAPSGLCVLVGGHGEAFASDHPSSGVPGWIESGPGGPMTGVSCVASGLCVAVDGAGRAIVARVPPPSVGAATPAEVTSTAATLSGSVDPNDASLGSCSFEWGTTTSYGQSVPCGGLPAAAGGAQAVNATISGLQPNTTYHYRLTASSAAGTGTGPDTIFTTAVSSNVPLVNPHPSIAGTPAVGQRLTCRSGVPSGSTAQLTYQWLRDLLAIPGATSSSYTVKGNDIGRHIQCQVTAKNAGGSATARSAFVTIPAQGVPGSAGETLVGRARVRGGQVSVPVSCSSRAAGSCRIVIRLTVVESLQAGRIVGLAARAPRSRPHARAGALRRVTITLGAARARLGRGQRAIVTLRLNVAGRRLLAARHRLPALLGVSGTVIGVIESVLSEQVVQLGAAQRASVRHGTRAR